MQVLVVDDSRVMRQIVIRTLRQAGFGGHEIIEAENGADGLTRAAVERPDLILSDWNMAVMGGLEFLTTLRASGSTSPFGFITSEGSASVRAEATAADARFLISKPFTAETFHLALTPYLCRTVQPASAALDWFPVSAAAASSTAEGGSSGPPLPTETTLPSRQAVRETFEMLMGRPVKVGNGDRVTLDLPTGPISVGTILDDHGRLAATVAADLPLAVYAGACLGLLPAGGAEDMVTAKELTATIGENFYEVLNVLSGAFNADGAPHVRLGGVYTDPTAMPAAALLTVKSLTQREDIFVEVAGYGTGNLSVVLTDQPG